MKLIYPPLVALCLSATLLSVSAEEPTQLETVTVTGELQERNWASN